MKHILFDFDGTLINTWPGIEATIRGSFRALDIPIDENTISPSLVGTPLHKVYLKLLRGDLTRAHSAVEKYRELFPSIGMPGARLYDGVLEMLQVLRSRGKQLFVVTARNEMIARQMMTEHRLMEFFTWIRGEQEGEAPENKAHMLGEVVGRFELDPGKCVMVGDRKYDMEAGQANGITTLGVAYGYGTGEELFEAGASKVVGSVEELQKVLVGR